MAEENWNGDDRRHRGGWHVGREIPIAMIVALLIQTGTGIWWASGLSAEMRSTQKEIQELKNERYTINDARRDQELAALRNENNERRISALESTERRINHDRNQKGL